MKQSVLKKLMEQMKTEQAQLFECREEREPPQRGHQYGNGIRMRRSVAREGTQTFAHLYDLQVSRAKIFSA
jgi:hypothetical protein